jgi:hypothetical protein
VVPCHRVIGKDGSLTGFGGGLETKRALLELEAASCVAPGGQLRLKLGREPSQLRQTAHAGGGRRA